MKLDEFQKDFLATVPPKQPSWKDAVEVLKGLEKGDSHGNYHVVDITDEDEDGDFTKILKDEVTGEYIAVMFSWNSYDGCSYDGHKRNVNVKTVTKVVWE